MTVDGRESYCSDKKGDIFKDLRLARLQLYGVSYTSLAK